jgi:hypothetical protein
MKPYAFIVPVLILAVGAYYVWAYLKPAPPTPPTPPTPPAPLSTAWMAEREEIRAFILETLHEELDEQVSHESIVEELNARMPLVPPWTWPCPDCSNTLQGVEEQLFGLLQTEAEKKYPAVEKDKIMQEAQRRFALFQIGETVSCVLRGGQGVNTKVEGVFSVLSPERIRIGSRWIHRQDLDDDTCARFYEAENGPAIRRYALRETSRFDAIVESYIFDERQARLPALFLAAGYVPDTRIKGASFKNPNAQAWMARSDAIEIAYEAKRKLVFAQLKSKLTKEIFEDKGYVWVPSAKDWEPRDYVEAKERRARFEAQQQSSVPTAQPSVGKQQRSQREPVAVEFVVTDGNSSQRHTFS